MVVGARGRSDRSQLLPSHRHVHSLLITVTINNTHVHSRARRARSFTVFCCIIFLDNKRLNTISKSCDFNYKSRQLFPQRLLSVQLSYVFKTTYSDQRQLLSVFYLIYLFHTITTEKSQFDIRNDVVDKINVVRVMILNYISPINTQITVIVSTIFMLKKTVCLSYDLLLSDSEVSCSKPTLPIENSILLTD